MIKTLRITSVAAVALAAVVLASVLGFLRPDTLARLNLGAPSDQQTERILSGPGAVERFKERDGSKKGGEGDTTPPLVKQAELFANFLTPPTAAEQPAVTPKNLPIKPIVTSKAGGAVAGKFELLGTCCSPSDPMAWIRLPDGTQQWARVGAEIGRVTIKEIRNGSIVCWDGTKESEMRTAAAPETSSLLETGKTANAAAGLQAAPSGTPAGPSRSSHAKPQTINAAHLRVSPVKPVITPNRTAGGAAFTPGAQLSKEEQESLSQLGNQLKAGADPNMIAGFKASLTATPNAAAAPNPADNTDTSKTTWKDRQRQDTRQQYRKRLAPPRAPEK